MLIKFNLKLKEFEQCDPHEMDFRQDQHGTVSDFRLAAAGDRVQAKALSQNEGKVPEAGTTGSQIRGRVSRIIQQNARLNGPFLGAHQQETRSLCKNV